MLLKGHSTKYLTRIPQDCWGHQKQGKPEKLYSQEEPTKDMMIKYNVVS